jgi:hypothetical protein
MMMCAGTLPLTHALRITLYAEKQGVGWTRHLLAVPRDGFQGDGELVFETPIAISRTLLKPLLHFKG